MGYTHYWWRPPEIDAPVFHAIRTDFERLILPLSDLSVELAGPLGEGLPVITEDEVASTGAANAGIPRMKTS